MEVKCSGCGQVYNIDEKYMPQTGTVSLPCRKCGQEIKIEDISPKEKKAPVETQLIPQVSHEDEGLEYFDPSKKTALIYTSDQQLLDQLNREIADVDIETRHISCLKDIRSRFMYHIYDAIILHQAKPEPDEQLKKIMAFINGLSPETRRQVYVIYAYIGGNRLDGLKAFSLGVDITISPVDFDDLANILLKGIDSKKAIYKLFSDYQAKTSVEAPQ